MEAEEENAQVKEGNNLSGPTASYEAKFGEEKANVHMATKNTHV